MNISADLQFTDSQSFRLFTEGVQALQSYERSASKESLVTAANRLRECVSKYPDILPRLYLGIVRTFQGYEGVDEALTLLHDVLNRSPQLRSTAKYYLADAYVAKYTPEAFEKADNLLEEMIAGSGTDPVDRVRAESLRTFTYVRQHLWENRSSAADLSADVQEAEKRLSAFKGHLDDPAVKNDLRIGLLAEYWNTMGLLNWFRASRTPAGSERDALIQTCIADFDRALQYSGNWVDAKSNKARVYQDLTQDTGTALRLWHEVLEVRDDAYANYMLGRFYEQSQPERAIAHYSKAAPHIPEAALGLARCYAAAAEFDNALDAFSNVPESSKVFPEATFTMGMIHEKLGEVKDAIDAYNRVPKLSQHFESAQKAVDRLQKKSAN